MLGLLKVKQFEISDDFENSDDEDEYLAGDDMEDGGEGGMSMGRYGTSGKREESWKRKIRRVVEVCMVTLLGTWGADGWTWYLFIECSSIIHPGPPSSLHICFMWPVAFVGHFEQRISFGYDAVLAQVRAEFDGEHLQVIVPRRPVPMTYHPARE